MTKISIIGSTGYTGAELVKIFSKRLDVQIAFLTSETLAGTPYSNVYPLLKGECDIAISSLDIDKVAEKSEAVFLCMPHGAGMEPAHEFTKRGTAVFDLSADFRMNDKVLFEEVYKTPHTRPELLKTAVYGLAEIYETDIGGTLLTACPGCYPTSALIPLLPLIKEGLIDSSSIIIDSKSGVSGAGKKPVENTHFCEANENVKPYGVFSHRHKFEIDHIINRYCGVKTNVVFTPHLMPLTRGMLSTIYTKSDTTLNKLLDTWHKYYHRGKYVRILSDGKIPSIASTAGTWYIDMALFKNRDNVIITSSLDNLMKGASSQAVQCFDIWHNTKPVSML